LSYADKLNHSFNKKLSKKYTRFSYKLYNKGWDGYRWGLISTGLPFLWYSHKKFIIRTFSIDKSYAWKRGLKFKFFRKRKFKEIPRSLRLGVLYNKKAARTSSRFFFQQFLFTKNFGILNKNPSLINSWPFKVNKWYPKNSFKPKFTNYNLNNLFRLRTHIYNEDKHFLDAYADGSYTASPSMTNDINLHFLPGRSKRKFFKNYFPLPKLTNTYFSRNSTGINFNFIKKRKKSFIKHLTKSGIEYIPEEYKKFTKYKKFLNFRLSKFAHRVWLNITSQHWRFQFFENFLPQLNFTLKFIPSYWKLLKRNVFSRFKKLKKIFRSSYRLRRIPLNFFFGNSFFTEYKKLKATKDIYKFRLLKKFQKKFINSRDVANYIQDKLPLIAKLKFIEKFKLNLLFLKNKFKFHYVSRKLYKSSTTKNNFLSFDRLNYGLGRHINRFLEKKKLVYKRARRLKIKLKLPFVFKASWKERKLLRPLISRFLHYTAYHYHRLNYISPLWISSNLKVWKFFKHHRKALRKVPGNWASKTLIHLKRILNDGTIRSELSTKYVKSRAWSPSYNLRKYAKFIEPEFVYPKNYRRWKLLRNILTLRREASRRIIFTPDYKKDKFDPRSNSIEFINNNLRLRALQTFLLNIFKNFYNSQSFKNNLLNKNIKFLIFTYINISKFAKPFFVLRRWLKPNINYYLNVLYNGFNSFSYHKFFPSNSYINYACRIKGKFGFISYFNFLKNKMIYSTLKNKWDVNFLKKLYLSYFSSSRPFFFFLNYFSKYIIKSPWRYVRKNKWKKRILKKVKKLFNVLNRVHLTNLNYYNSNKKKNYLILSRKFLIFDLFNPISFKNNLIDLYLNNIKSIRFINLFSTISNIFVNDDLYLLKNLPNLIVRFLCWPFVPSWITRELRYRTIKRLSSFKLPKKLLKKFIFLLSKKFYLLRKYFKNILNRFVISPLKQDKKLFNFNNFDDLAYVLKKLSNDDKSSFRNNKMLSLFKKSYHKKFNLTNFSNIIYTKFNADAHFVNKLKTFYINSIKEKKINLRVVKDFSQHIKNSAFFKIRLLFMNFISLLTRRIYLILLKRRIIFYLMNFFTFKFVHLYLLPLKFDVSAFMFVQFMVLKFLQRFKLRDIINSVINYLDRTSFLSRVHNGYRVMILGRFNRRVRITYHWIIKGKVSLTSRYSYVDYSKQVIMLKNGVCSIKFWLSFSE